MSVKARVMAGHVSINIVDGASVYLQLIFISLHSCALLFLFFFSSAGSGVPSTNPVVLSPSVATWLAWM
jgi:hypothetical protein